MHKPAPFCFTYRTPAVYDVQCPHVTSSSSCALVLLPTLAGHSHRDKLFLALWHDIVLTRLYIADPVKSHAAAPSTDALLPLELWLKAAAWNSLIYSQLERGQELQSHAEDVMLSLFSNHCPIVHLLPSLLLNLPWSLCNTINCIWWKNNVLLVVPTRFWSMTTDSTVQCWKKYCEIQMDVNAHISEHYIIIEMLCWQYIVRYFKDMF